MFNGVSSQQHNSIIKIALDNFFLLLFHTIFDEKINKIPRSNQGDQFEHPKFTQ
jgi:hypothetical protein